MVICTIGYIVIGKHTGEKAVVIFVICFYKVIDSYSDGYQGLFQLKDRIDLSRYGAGNQGDFKYRSFFSGITFYP